MEDAQRIMQAIHDSNTQFILREARRILEEDSDTNAFEALKRQIKEHKIKKAVSKPSKTKKHLSTELVEKNVKNELLKERYRFFLEFATKGNSEGLFNELTTCPDLISFEGDVKDPNSQGWTALCLACSQRHISCVQILLEKTADVNRGLLGMSPLHFACKHHDDGGIVLLLLSHGADVRASDRNKGFTALHYACQSGNTTAAILLLSYGALLTQTDIRGNSPLHIAAFEVSGGYNKDGNHDWTPLTQAVYNFMSANNPSLLQITAFHPNHVSHVQHDVIQNNQSFCNSVSIRNNSGKTPLHLLVGNHFKYRQDHAKTQKQVLATVNNLVEDWGAEYDIRDNDGKFPFECTEEVCKHYFTHPTCDPRIGCKRKEETFLKSLMVHGANWRRRKHLACFRDALVSNAEERKKNCLTQRPNSKALIVFYYRRFARHIASMM